VFATGERVVTRSRAEREFSLRQQVAGVAVGLFVGGLIGPALLVMDHDRPYRGIFMIAIGVLAIAISIPAWFKLPKDQRTWKALRSHRGRH
jgi:MFS family permease